MLMQWKTILPAVLFLGILGCNGIRYSEVSPDARDFHPRRITVLPSDSRTFPEAGSDVDRLFHEVLSEQKWFDDVVGGEAVGRRLKSDEVFRKAVTDYQAKLEKVSFSDPLLSKTLGELTGAEALLLVRVDSWNHTTEKDNKVARVGFSIRMVEAKTGRILWTAVHHKIRDYLIIRPELPDVARDLIREMVGYMPR